MVSSAEPSAWVAVISKSCKILVLTTAVFLYHLVRTGKKKLETAHIHICTHLHPWMCGKPT